ncbi:hypothetical protein BDK51DRAFT_26110 [Blyttiomyces helicus]|uniref:Uncharacterized protein n=1 Tax=Blyttiomyces helicus TaxID=388810 RepID=A0A4P9WN03_9FUNG|nr:hypothetical protein BDK51DRAFT_26110 [Blyttiomyces helicus]|eukprot:RKO93068.1 hypothetical protein BDK51DRAFT_26110 [Blyttiomyces helicus]
MRDKFYTPATIGPGADPPPASLHHSRDLPHSRLRRPPNAQGLTSRSLGFSALVDIPHRRVLLLPRSPPTLRRTASTSQSQRFRVCQRAMVGFESAATCPLANIFDEIRYGAPCGHRQSLSLLKPVIVADSAVNASPSQKTMAMVLRKLWALDHLNLGSCGSGGEGRWGDGLKQRCGCRSSPTTPPLGS